MANSYFDFKQFRINQEGSAMKVGTDGVLLGAWTDVEETERILDVGTGSGLIAIMLAQRTEGNTKIDAVEIDSDAYQQAVDNSNNCQWHSNISIYHQSFQEFEKENLNTYDRIVSNPPYFMNGLNAKSEGRTKARNADHLPFEDLLNGAKKMLKPDGTLSVVLPIEEGNYFERIARLNGFCLKRKVSVLPNPGKPAKRFLLEFSLEETEVKEYEISVENGQRHVYSSEYIELTKAFYLKF
ncbi:methyltransferase [Marinifilum sp. N1E240]|uniref:tRNA1(Val) (adenine(37)-N6)-methyltransferase n=1 Tax=Marinifilum sp. N1E240 TaxID=2608082 RepID=UPI00128BB7CA|nr:methyltransferase [Marinifilum sp. N1E240]MPQ48773.1 methyltransferase [Marinifilum sp. N1E240]